MSLEALLDEKGRISRLIGEAKKRGESAEELIARMKLVSSQIGDLKAAAKLSKVNAEADSEKPTAEEQSPALPQHFSEQPFKSSAVSDSVDIRIVDERDKYGWDCYVNAHPNACVYHLWEFRQAIEQSFGHSAVYVGAFAKGDSGDRLCGVLPLVEVKSRLFGHYFASVPFFNYGGPLADSEATENALLAFLHGHAATGHEALGEAEHVELRMAKQIAGLEEDSDSRWATKTHKVSMLRQLPEDRQQLWSDLGTKLRAQVKKAQRFEPVMKFGRTELLDDFYRVFARNMRDLGTPVYAKSFFRHLLESSDNHLARLGVVYQQGRPVACCYLIGYNDTLEIPWASTLREANHMNMNMFMYWEVLGFAIEQQYRFFDFGRSSKDASTYRFKKQWGAEPVQLYWQYYLHRAESLPDLSPNNPKYDLLIKVWQRLPVWLANIIGPPVVKYLP